MIETNKGRKRIKDIRVGDSVLTHRGRYRPVTRLYSRVHVGEMVSINYSRRGRCDQTITATPEHPVLVERPNGVREWVPISEVSEGDTIFVRSAICSVTGTLVPYWLRMSKHANPMDVAATREKVRVAKGGYKNRRKGGSDGEIHLVRDILPFCKEMSRQGWSIVPVGGGVIPDAVGFKDGHIVAFELEARKGDMLLEKKQKYEGAPISSYIDRVEWIMLGQRMLQPRSWYEPDTETGFCKVVVVGKTTNPVRGARNRKRVTVYNFSVEEDESYVAGNVVVHNCTQDQTPFARKKNLDYHIGGMIVELEQNPDDGAIVGCRVEIVRYFNRGYYNNRWSASDGVTLPERRPAGTK